MPEPQNQIGPIRVKKANWNLPAPVLFEEAVRRGEGRVALGGSLVVTTGKHTGRAANDKFIVRNAVTDPFTIIDLPAFQTSKDEDGTNGPTAILVDFQKKLTLIASTAYAGEMKKSAFSLMNFVLPQKGTMPMHASANIGPQGDTAVFFGLSGTGKTTLSADSKRTLIGDDEHGWGPGGVFNFEGGCYAKVISLSPEAEPEIYATTRMFGTVLENVVMNADSRELDLDDATLAENTRACYPLSYIPNASKAGMGGQPRNVVMLTYDAFGVLPPIARLTP